MKFVRYGERDEEKPGIVDNQGIIRDISSYLPDICPKILLEKYSHHFWEQLDLSTLPAVDPAMRLGPCVGSVGKIVCIGFNSHLHASEMGVKNAQGTEPILFLKPTSALSGAHDPILYTRHTKKLDWEAELALIIGKKGKYIPRAAAKDHIFGYACFNDLSERYLQFETADKQFTKGKGFDGAASLGPYLVTQADIDNTDAFQIKLWVNDTLRQNFSTSDYIYHEADVIHYLSQYFTLYPGDIIAMGSGPGSACAWDNAYLHPGDSVRLSITGLGEQQKLVVAE